MFRFTLIYVHKFLENAPVQVLTQLCHCQIFSQIRITHKSCFCMIFLIYFFIYFLYISLYISYTFLYIFLIHFFIYFLYISLFDIIYEKYMIPDDTFLFWSKYVKRDWFTFPKICQGLFNKGVFKILSNIYGGAFCKNDQRLKPFTTFAKSSILNVWQGPKYTERLSTLTFSGWSSK